MITRMIPIDLLNEKKKNLDDTHSVTSAENGQQSRCRQITKDNDSL